MIAVIAGASGLVGSQILHGLLADTEISQIIALVRKPLASQHPKLKQVLESNFSNLTSHADELKGDLYICALGSTIKAAGSQMNFRKIDYEAVVNFGILAQSHGARSLVVISAKGADANSRFFYNRVKGDAELKLKSLKLKRLVIFQPGLLLGERSEVRMSEKLAITISSQLQKILPASVMNSFSTEVSQLAKRVIAESKKPGPQLQIIEAANI